MKLGMVVAVCAVWAMVFAACEREESETMDEVRLEPSRSQGSEGERSPAQPAQPSTPTPAPPEPVEPAADPAPAAELDPELLNPGAFTDRAPPRYTVELATTEGPIRIDVTRAWAPNGADRFFNLVRAGYFTDVAFFRVISGFMVQGGIHGRREVNSAWREAGIPDDPVTQSNTRGMVTFATSGPDSRTTQFFISFGDNSNLDPMGFSPFGRVREGDMAVVDRLYAGYGESAPRGRGPVQAQMQSQGNEYLRAQFPELDYIESARIVSP